MAYTLNLPFPVKTSKNKTITALPLGEIIRLTTDFDEINKFREIAVRAATRCSRYHTLMELSAPGVVINNEIKLISSSVKSVLAFAKKFGYTIEQDRLVSV